jgi:hypothetical protein
MTVSTNPQATQHVGAAMAATAAAGARDAKRLEPLVCFFILFYFYYTNVYFFKASIISTTLNDHDHDDVDHTPTLPTLQASQHVEAAMAATAAAETAMAVAAAAAATAEARRHLESIVCFLFYLFITLMLILGPLKGYYTYEWRRQARQGREMGGDKWGLKTQRVSSPGCVFFFVFCYYWADYVNK